MQPLLSVRDLQVSYGHIAALRGVSLELAEGSAVAVVGTNGAGKSTLLRAIVGLAAPRAGAVEIDGHSVLAKSTHVITRAGTRLVPEGRGLFPALTVAENLQVVEAEVGGAPPELREAIFEYFPRLSERLGQTAGTMSGGEQQMLAISMGLLAQPRLLLVDEPSLGLAPIIVQQLFEVFHDLRRRGMSLIVVEQYLNLVLDLVDEVVVLDKGKVTGRGEPAEFATADVAETYFGSSSIGSRRADASTATVPQNEVAAAFTAGELRRLERWAAAEETNVRELIRRASLAGLNDDPAAGRRNGAGGANGKKPNGRPLRAAEAKQSRKPRGGGDVERRS